MRKVPFFLISLFVTLLSHAQGFEWSTSGGYVGTGGTGSYGAIDIARDINGNIYVFNDGNQTQQCQGDTVKTLGVFGLVQSVVYKFNPSGILQWAKGIGASFNPYAIEVDEAGSVYLLGYTSNDSIITVDTAFRCIAGGLYIVKLDSTGKFMWSKFTVTNVTVGGVPNLLKYQSGKLYHQSGPLGIQCIDTSGNVINSFGATFFSPTSAQTAIIYKSAAIFSNGDLLFVGEHRGKLAFNNDTLPVTQQDANSNRYFYVRCTPSLQLVWYKSLGGFMQNFRYQIGVCIDQNDNVYSIAPLSFGSKIYFGTDSIENFSLGNGTSAFLKMDNNGALIWAKDVDAISPSSPYGMTCADDNSGVYVCGTLGGGVTYFDNIGLEYNASGRGYIAKLSPNGVFTDAFYSANPTTIPNSNQLFPYYLMSNGSGKYYVCGQLTGSDPYAQSCVSYPTNRGFFLSQFNGVKDTVAKPAFSFIREGRKVFFSANLKPGTQFVSWHFGDGTSTTQQQNPTHTYTGAGYFPAVLTTNQACLTRKDTAFVLYKGIQKVLPQQIANNQLQTIFIKGGFPFTTATVKLIKGNTVLNAINVVVPDSGTIQANFLLQHEPIGFYDLVVNAPGFSDTLFNGLEMVPENKRLPEVQILGQQLALVNSPFNYQVIVSNPGNVNLYGVPVYIGADPRCSVAEVFNYIIRDSVNLIMTAALGGDFVLAYDSTTNDSALVAAFLIPVLAANSSEVIEFKMRSTSPGNRLLYARVDDGIFDSIQLVNLGLRSSCDFLADPMLCLLDALGEIPTPVTSCGVAALSLGCAIGNAANDLVGTRNRQGIRDRYVVDVFNLLSDIAGVATCSGGPFTPKDKINEFLIKFLGQGLNAGASKLSGGSVTIPTGFTPLDVNIPGSCIDVLKKPLSETMEGDLIIRSVTSLDPNDKMGPVGQNTDNYINDKKRMHYRIRFENVDTATAPASFVEVSDTLDDIFFDISTLRFTGFGFADSSYFLVTANGNYAQEIDLRPAKNTILRIEINVDTTNYILTWRFYSFHPVTKEPVTIVSDGFLNPNVTSPEGEGYVSYSIMPKPNRPHLQQVRNTASIVFDNNSAIITEPWINTIDKQKPSSQVLSLPSILTDTTFYITWTGSDPHAGILNYDVYVVINDTATYQLLNDTKFDSLGVKGQYGSTYKFYTIARDRVGNIEDAPAQPDAIVTLQEPVGIKHISDNLFISVVPNPASNILTVTLSEVAGENSTITITGVNGAVELSEVMQGGVREKQINISMLATGVYFVTIRNGNMNTSKLFVKE